MASRIETQIGAADGSTYIEVPIIRGLNDDEHPLREPQPGPPPALSVDASSSETSPEEPKLSWEDMVE